ncbi:type II secretion system F family protein [Dermatobacter hominis]|uniref:type II secretion system F family protein n=1 Tax=Dermatobacter hominis TaxID=2884263 RepID=UPI001D123610|nr:type II secretion system F family protein [Dermatobacter hominis]UDY35795.1 type II secretion system F family protein [Dermatobacter hominis]
MSSILFAAIAAVGTSLLVMPRPTRSDAGPRPTPGEALAAQRDRAELALQRAGLDGVSPLQFGGTVLAVAVAATFAATLVVGPGVGALVIGALAGAAPIAMWRSRRTAARRAAQEHWPRLIEELRVLTGPMGRPIPQALLEVGSRGPVELRPAFAAAQREWNLTTDFERTVTVLKDRLADPTADATCETLLVVHEVGGDLDARLSALAEDRRRDLHDRKDAQAKLAGARTARLFVVLVPIGMAIAGTNVGAGRAAYRSGTGQVLVVLGIALVVACWVWGARLMRLPVEERVFDR